MRQNGAALLVAVALVAAVPVAAQGDLSDVEIRATHVAGKVHMLEGRGGNIGVSAGPDGILIVDDQFAPLAAKIRAALAKLGAGKPDFVLNTHWHGDHTGSNAEFGLEATIIAHHNVRQRLSTRQELFGRVIEPSPAEALPVITFGDGLTVHFNGEEIEVIHLPRGHTDGDSVVFFKGSNVVHMGDDFFAGTFPFVDLGSGGNVEGLAANIAKVIERLPADVKVIPGHGPLSTLDDLKAYHGMLVETIGIVRKRMASGKTLDEVRERGLPERWSSWSGGFIDTATWLQIVHESLSGGPVGDGGE